MTQEESTFEHWIRVPSPLPKGHTEEMVDEYAHKQMVVAARKAGRVLSGTPRRVSEEPIDDEASPAQTESDDEDEEIQWFLVKYEGVAVRNEAPSTVQIIVPDGTTEIALPHSFGGIFSVCHSFNTEAVAVTAYDLHGRPMSVDPVMPISASEVEFTAPEGAARVSLTVVDDAGTDGADQP